MSELPGSFLSHIFAKTAGGQLEIQARALGLAPMARRVLVLVDGRRSGQDLSAFVPADGIADCLSELLAQRCITEVARTPGVPAPAPEHPQQHPPENALDGLPLSATRSAHDLEKARNFMTNTVNNLFGHHNRITLIESIFSCKSSAALRDVYPAWENAVSSIGSGKKRLPELREKLFTVL